MVITLNSVSVSKYARTKRCQGGESSTKRICTTGIRRSYSAGALFVERPPGGFNVPTLGFHEPARAVVALRHLRICSGAIRVLIHQACRSQPACSRAKAVIRVPRQPN